ncbi:MAG: LamG domain-containing protein [Fimbriimonas sp.]|nr:LamG domain-containing protein [Fimbriimonas sp.]
MDRHIRWRSAVAGVICVVLIGCGGGGANTSHNSLSTGLIHWWKFDGNANDSVGALSTNPIGPVSYISTNGGQAIVFNGTTTGINLPEATDMQFQASYSISAWGKLYSYVDPSELWSTIIFCGDDRNGLDPFFVQVDPSGTLQFATTGATAALGINATSQFPLNKWVMVTGTYDRAAGIESLYVNGKLDIEALQVPNLTPVVPLDPAQSPGIGIGTNNNFPNDFYNMGWNGAIADLRVYDRALSATEVQALYNQTSAQYK